MILNKNKFRKGPKIRKNSVVVAGGEFGDEGKGKLTDAWVSKFAKKGRVVVYRDNGGANAGHTLEFENGKRVALHQLASGIFVKKATVFLSKGMVIHPSDLVEEMNQVKIVAGKDTAKILIDEMAVLALDTHRAFEAVLKTWEEGGKGSTAKGISPAYSDVLLRHPLRIRDLANWNQEKIEKHYRLYEALVKGLGADLAKVEVSSSSGKNIVGKLDIFIKKLKYFADKIRPMVINSTDFLKKNWVDEKVAFVFEKAMAIGLDARWGVYPDITASDTTFEGIRFSSEGIIDPDEIEKRVIVLKGTYMSSVGSRKIPTLMNNELAEKIRTDCKEFGATTGRVRDIAYVDLPAIKFYKKVSRPNYLVQTHVDVTYPKTPIKICVAYKIRGKKVDYRPDQEFLNKVSPVYIQMPSWDGEKVREAKKFDQLPKNAKKFLNYLCNELELPLLAVSTGPGRDHWFECL